MFWNFIGLVLVIVNCLMVPFNLSFYFDEHSTKLPILINLYFTVNILVRFRTAFYSNGLLISDQRKVLITNLNFSLVLEVLAIISGVLYLIFSVDALKYLTFFTLVRVRHIQGFVGKMEDNAYFSKEVTHLFKLLWLILVILTVAHLGGCVFHLIAVGEFGKDPNNWLTVYTLPDATTLELYVASLYWAFATMITVGYGDIVPSTTKERIYTVFIMVMACGVFGYGINTIEKVFTEINMQRSEHRKKIRQITNYMKRKHLSRAMQVRVRKYLEYILEGERFQGEKNVLDFLSTPLQNEVLVEINVKALHGCKVLSYSFTQKFLNSLARELRESTLSPEENIFKEADDVNKAIYFISTGKVNIYYERSERVLKTLAKGDYFGEISFFSGLPRSAGAKSVNFTSVYSIPREKFIEAVKYFSQDREQFYYIQDKIRFENNHSLLRIACYSCGEEGHIASQCSKVHFQMDRPKTIEAQIKEEAESRKEFQRKERKSFSPWANLEELRNEAQRLGSHHNNNLEAALTQTQYEASANFYNDEFALLLEYQIYLPYHQKFDQIAIEAAQLDSIGSVENLNTVPSNKPYQETLLPPNQLFRNHSGESRGNLSPQHARNAGLVLAHQSSIANGIAGAENLLRGSTQFPRQNSMAVDYIPTRVRWDTVQNFEIYYPHGNITVISRKYNIIANETMMAITIGRKTGQKINRNILKSIDILSRGSIYGNFAKKSSESLISINSPLKKKSVKDPDLSQSKANSLFISNQPGSSSQVNSVDPSSSDAFQRKQPEVNQSSIAKRDSSFYLAPEKLNESSSVVSSTSVILHHAKDVQEPSAAGRRLSRFGALNLLHSSKMSSSFIGSEFQKPSQGNLLGLQEDRTLSNMPNSFGTEQNVASSILPRSNEPESSSNNNIMNFWKEKQKSKASFQKSEGSAGSFVSPTFKKLSVDLSQASQRDSRLNSDTFTDNEESRSQISLFNYQRNDVSPVKFSSDRKTVQTHLRKAMKKLKEQGDKKSLSKKSQFSSFAHKKKLERANSVGKESKVAKLIKREGFIKPLKDIMVVLQADKQMFLENFLSSKQPKKN